MPTIVDLGNLGSFGFRLQGIPSGWVSSAGDFNGDGFDDVAATTPATNRAYILYGHGPGFPTIDVPGLQAPNGTVVIPSPDTYVLRIAGAGDVNGDGFDDLLVTTTDYRGWYYSGSSSAYVIFGRPGSPSTINLANLGPSDGFKVGAPPSWYYNVVTIAGSGDVNGDGFDDILIGSLGFPDRGGSTTLLFGKHSGFTDLALENVPPTSGFQIFGIQQSLPIGRSSTFAGDINGDGYDDIIVGSYMGDSGGFNSGQAYVIFGKASGFVNIQLNSPAPTNWFMIQGDAAEDWAGFDVSGAGDINRDGFDDLIISAPGGDDGGADAGEVYVIFGHAGAFTNIDLTNLAPGVGFIIQGDLAFDRLGGDISSAGDVNGDGYADLLIGASSNDAAGAQSGAAYLIFGHAGGFTNIDLSNLTATQGVIFRGPSANTYVGSNLSSAGDLNNDGFDDIVIGTGSGGAAYVIFGRHSFVADAVNDINGDTRSDLLLRKSDGSLSTWLASASGLAPGWGISLPADWKVADTGDFNGDGRDDVLLRNDNGSIATWLGAANGSLVAGWGTAVSLDQKVAGTGDFNGDGFDDILWRTDAGGVTVWLGAPNGGFSVGPSETLAASWKVAGTGDINGDGRDDIVWRNDSGALSTWLGAAGGTFGAGWGTAAAAMDWKVSATGDFNGDGRADLLWRSDGGQLATWLGASNGGFSPAWGTGAPFGWSVASIGDLSGDGFDDVVWRQDATGNLTAWLGASNGGFVMNVGTFAATLPAGWQIEDPFL